MVSEVRWSIVRRTGLGGQVVLFGAGAQVRGSGGPWFGVRSGGSAGS